MRQSLERALCVQRMYRRIRSVITGDVTTQKGCAVGIPEKNSLKTNMDLGAHRRPSRRRSINMAAMLQRSKTSDVPAESKTEAFPDFEHDIVTEEHRKMFSIVSYQFDLPEDEVEKFALRSPKGPELLKKFDSSNDSALLFFYQKEKPFAVESHGQKVNLPLILTDGKDQGINGDCFYFMRSEKTDKLIMGRFQANCAEKDSMRKIIKNPLENIYMPCFSLGLDWEKNKLNTQEKINACHNSFQRFANYIDSTEENYQNIVRFEGKDKIDLSVVKNSYDLHKFVLFDDKVRLVEEMMIEWIQKIQEVVAESGLIRVETDDVGPLNELCYWRYILCKLSSVAEFVATNKVQTCIRILETAHSRILKNFKEQERKLKDKQNEAHDIVKYLYRIESLCAKFYENNLDLVKESIPLLISQVRLIHLVSRHYDTPEHITSFFKKVTNQIVIVCKNYITDSGKLSLWNMSHEQAINKMQTCIDLYRKYKKELEDEKKNVLTHSGEKKFEFFLVPVLETFHSFRQRLVTISQLFNIIEEFSVLNQCHIEGIEIFSAKLKSIVNTIKSKSYDLLDHRKLDFAEDYEEFLKQIEELKVNLQQFINSHFKIIKNGKVYRSILLLKRFQNLKISGMDTYSQYIQLFKFFEQEMDTIKKMYNNKQQLEPRLIPPFAEKISFARALFKRIENPMELLKDHLDKLAKPDKDRIVKTYNKLAEILTEYMILQHNAYCRKIESGIKELQKTILILSKRVENGSEEWEVNFTDTLYMMITDSRSIVELGLNLPEQGKFLITNSEKLLCSSVRMQELTYNFKTLKLRIPPIVEPLIRPVVKRVEASLRPGVTYLQWLSTNIDTYILNVKKALENLKYVVWKGICKTSEDSLLHICVRYDLVLEELVSFLIEKGQKSIEESKNIDLFGGVEKESYLGIKPEEKLELQREAENLLKYLEDLLAKAIGECTYRSLDDLCATFRYSGKIIPVLKENKESIVKGSRALFLTNLIIKEDTVCMDPNMNTIQSALNDGVSIIQKSINNVASRREESNDKEAKTSLQRKNSMTFHKRIVSLSETKRLLSFLDTAAKSIQPEITKVCEIFLKYKDIWAQDKEKQIQRFVDKNPYWDDYELKRKLEYFESLKNDLSQVPFSYTVAGIELRTEKIVKVLKTEVNHWYTLYGSYINKKYFDMMSETYAFITEKMAILTLPILELKDVQRAMSCFEEVQEHYIDIDNLLVPIKDAYALLHKHKLLVDIDEMDKAQNLPNALTELLQKSRVVANDLTDQQSKYLEILKECIESLKKDVSVFDEDYQKAGPMVPGITPEEASKRFDNFTVRLDELYSRYESNKDGEKLFGLQISEYPVLVQTKSDMVLLRKLFALFNVVMSRLKGYYIYAWNEVNLQVITDELTDFQNKCMRLPKGVKEWEYFHILKQRIEDFKETCPLLARLKNEAMTMDHWHRIEKVCSHKFDDDQSKWTLGTVMEAPLLQFKDDVEDICIAAEKEKEIQAKINQVMAEWSIEELYFSAFKNRGELLLKGIEAGETMVKLEDGLMTLGSLLSNRYSAALKPIILEWLQYLTTATEVIENWLLVQNLWVYLEAVFVGGDIAKQLPKEAERFSKIDSEWVSLMKRAHEKSNVIECCSVDDTMSTKLPYLLQELEACQKSLVGYLESKRRIFPRFFFISDPALLEILGQASDSHTIQAHLLGLFENVFRVNFDPGDYNKIIGIRSKEGDEIKLDRPVRAEGNVENWLGDLLEVQQKSLNTVIKQAYDSLNAENFDLIPFIDQYIAQVALLGIQILWTRDGQEALTYAKASKRIMSFTNKKFTEILRKLIAQTTLDLAKFVRIKYETLITIHVHQKDIFESLVKMKIKTPTDFEWLKQARFYYYLDDNLCMVKITDVNFIYQNEYLGCSDRLVITPLTDRCYITLAQALGMSMGGAPAGPAGTGKTETTKDMGKALGKYVVVFNCSDQMDFRGLGRIYKGLAQSGSWGCFDEFNRIELPVLSVAAQQINIVLSARKEKKTEFLFSDGDILGLNPEFGLFITMNPGYAGRQELPENLKVMFRSVAMMVPDRQIIMRVKLASCGFQENTVLARKFFVLYKLCEEQLTKQVHYDFGLRNILSVLRTLGAQKRSRPEEEESSIVMSVLSSMNVSKLVDEDEPLFNSLINDLFPGIIKEAVEYDDLQVAIARQAKTANLINHPSWNLKLIQLYETQVVRHGMMVLGPSGAGKTCCIRVLMRAMTDCGQPHKEMRMNPKAITAAQMFGRLDVATNDWTDGIFSTLWRRTLKAKKDEYIWLILDGPVDAIWIENLNSVLDDNKTLTLANGDRIPMSPTCKIIFEPHNIDNASPATVSRNGMVYMSSSGLNWEPILEGWLSRRSASEANILRGLFAKIFAELCRYVMLSLNPKMDLLECNYMKQTMDLLDGLIPTKNTSISPLHYERLFVFSLMWSFGALLELDHRSRMEVFLKKHKPKLDLPEIHPATKQTIYEFVVDSEGNWLHWSNKIEEYVYPTDTVPAFSSILVPNVDNVRTNFLIDVIQKQGKAVLLIGEQGTAKTVMIKGYLNSIDPNEFLWKNLSFSSATTPQMFQRAVESIVEKKVGATYGPPGSKKMTIFIDDINMPEINEWGDQVTNEIVRQLMENKGFYNLDKPGDFSNFVDIRFVGAMIQPGGGRNDIPSRLKRQFSVFNCTLPAPVSIDKIFGVIGCGYFCEERFSEEIVDFIKPFVPATRILWQDTKVKMLPTPAKFHYVFNLRDLSRIWEGMLKIEKEQCSTKNDLLALWKHECTRVIADRFTNNEDKEWFSKRMSHVLAEEIGEEYLEILPEEPYFVNFLRDPPEPEDDAEDTEVALEMPLVYEQVPSYETLADRLTHFMNLYNENSQGMQMDLVFFKDAMVHLIKIARILSTPQGSALLVGVGGSGKQSLTRLAASIYKHDIFQITLTRSYNVGNLIDDLKLLYKKAGEEGKEVTFIFTDNEVKEESFLEFLNTILGSGEVTNLFPKDEQREILDNLIPVMKKEFPKRDPTQDNLYNYFITRTRANLHLILCFSPAGNKFQKRSLKFPGLISGCTMDWLTSWPADALIEVSTHFIGNFEVECTPEVKHQMVGAMGIIHDSVSYQCNVYFQRYRRLTYVTPKSYLAFINGYKAIYTEKKREINNLAIRINSGLTKLQEATISVNQLKVELAIKEKDLVVASAEVDEVVIDVTKKTESAEKVKNEVQVVKDRAQVIVDKITKEKAIAEQKLEAAKPALEAAEEALKTIKPSDIATVRKLGKPPHLIKRIMDCVLILFQIPLDKVVPDPDKKSCPTPSWKSSLKLMGSSTFLTQLQEFPKDNINDETVELLEPYIRMEDYNLESAKKTCGQVAGLLSWTLAMNSFYAVNKEVIPLKANLALLEAQNAVASKELATAQASLDEKQAELDKVNASYKEAMAKKQNLQSTAEICKRKMITAEALIAGLQGEKARWTEDSKRFQSQINRLVGDAVLLAAFLSYSGPFNQEFRNILFNFWQKELNNRNIPHTENLNLINSLTDIPTIADWGVQGLPNDELSLQNGIIVTESERYPLLIDPQGQGKSWLMKKEAHNQLIVTNLNHKFFRQFFEDALSQGRPMLIEDVGEELDPVLDNVLDKNFVKSGTILKVKIGDKEVDFLKSFRLYITTKLPNPTYAPEITARTSVIDFTVTMKGLEDQLLGRVILAEKQELEAERVELLENVAANKRKTKELEDNLLHKLATTEGSLVDDESLIEVLKTTKETAADVAKQLEVADSTNKMIDLAREEYRPVASRGSILYFLICDMAMVNVMYQTSLGQFLRIFDISLERSEKSPRANIRIENIINFLTFEVFKYTCRGLYETHKFLFTLLLCIKIDLSKGNITHEEFGILIKGGAALDLKAVEPKTCRWITDMTWLNLVALTKLDYFREILVKVKRSEKLWKAWFEKDAPEEEAIPDGYGNLNSFRKLLLVRSWCQDRTLAQARKYVADSMGQVYADPVILNMDAMWSESTPRSPLICLLTMGSDPTQQIESLAKSKGLYFGAISMGQGQEIHARKLMDQNMEKGGWMLLQNCHLGLDFMDELLDRILTTENVDSTFRCWITTEVHPKFPISLLQASIKFTNEPPQGMRAGLKRTYSTLTQKQLDAISYPQWQPMLYAVSFMHTAVQERRKFGPLGWNIPYEFNTADWGASVQFIQNHLDDMNPKTGVSWLTVRYMLGEVQYGGRVTDDYDKRLLNTFAEEWFGNHMFNSTFAFYQGYGIPSCPTIEQYMEYIGNLPGTDTPQVFGLHPNADITYQSNRTKEVLDTILSIQPKDTGGGEGETREAVVYRMAKEMMTKLPPDYVSHEVKERIKAAGNPAAPMQIFIKQEIDRMQRVISNVRSTLMDLELAIDGTIVMNEMLRDALDSIYDARIPKTWSKVSWDSSTLGFWFTELLERNTQFSNWIFERRPSCFWMTGFFNPQGFLTAMRQEVSRAHDGWPLDTVTLQNDVTRLSREAVKDAPKDGVYVYGLFLDGASWDKKNTMLVEPSPKTLFTALPVVYIYAENSTDPPSPTLYQCPVYKKPRRTDLTYITPLWLKTKVHPNHWILRGVALLCDIK
ncbi:hypothetical protein JTE90_009368 [Oedothorax gibbosus]|uniref:AAA+ ATPase domain-containing protein n=1 Tax=Oedothorax gibbosus TaxID=931172 RepID=A0AAV6VVK3_9ARAC|nr:hypothetical protein JTE90_009368 [Oedothorax gibbosus]